MNTHTNIQNAALELWRERYARSEAAFAAERAQMDERERLYAGERAVAAAGGGSGAKAATHVRNIIAELIEAISVTLPSNLELFT